MSFNTKLTILLVSLISTQTFGCYNDEKTKAFALLDTNGNGYLSLEEMIDKVEIPVADYGVMLWDLNEDDQVSCQGTLKCTLH